MYERLRNEMRRWVYTVGGNGRFVSKSKRWEIMMKTPGNEAMKETDLRPE